MLECVINISEGRRRAVIESLARACGASLLDVHVDVDHHRSVFTLAGPGSTDAEDAARRLTRTAADALDLTEHRGVHPRLGVVDVVPFVALGNAPATIALGAARGYAEWIVAELAVPVFFYGDAEPSRRPLPEVRRRAFRDLVPDLGPPIPHPRLGATAVGARPVLVAVNCELDLDDVALARRIASSVRERDGGLPGVRALGLRLASRERAQVSMNLIDLDRCGVERACDTVREHARAAGADVAAVELIGLLPNAELSRCTDEFVSWSGLRPEQTIEARLAAVAPGGEADADGVPGV